MITALDLHQAVVRLWNQNNLSDEFTQYWPSGKRGKFLVLAEGEAGEGTPIPYCVFSFDSGNTISRMSSSGSKISEERDVLLEFSIHAKQESSKSSKTIAGELTSAIMKVYGGHPTEGPQSLSLDNGGVLNVRYENEYGAKTGDEEYQSVINYLIKTDVPVRI